MKTIKVKVLSKFIEKTRGLMFSSSDTPTYFETRWGIHTFFVKQTITVLVLDNENVIKIISHVKPFSIFLWNPKYSRIIEFPNKNDNYKINEKIQLIEG